MYCSHGLVINIILDEANIILSVLAQPLPHVHGSESYRQYIPF